MKKIISLFLIITLVITLFIACGPKEEVIVMTAEEIFSKVHENEKMLENYAFDADLSLELSGLESSLGISAPMALKLEGEMKDFKNLLVTLDIDTGQGINLTGDVYITEDQILIYSPILGSLMGAEYIKINLDTLPDLFGATIPSTESQQEITELIETFTEEKGFSINDIILFEEVVEEVEIVVNDENINVKKLVATVDFDKITEFVLDIIDFISTNEDAQNILFENSSQEEFDQLIIELNNGTIKTEIKEAMELITVNNIDYVFYVDEDFLTVKVEFGMDVDFADAEENVNIKVDGNMYMFKFGEVQEIILPQVTDDQILDLSEMY